MRDNLGSALTLRAAGTGGDSIRIWSRQGPGATYYPELTLTFSPATTDDEAPSVPSNVAAQVTDDDVALSWDASSDNVGVTRYRVYRGATAGFTADEGSFVDEVLSPTRTYTDNNRPAGTYYYKVIARDAAGNLSAASTAAEATVAEPPPAAETVTLLPTADSYVVSTQPTTNNGLNNQLTSRVTSPSLESFLKFDLPAAPAGTTLTGASLTVRTSNDVTAATNDVTEFEVVSNGWAEDTITWSNRPTGAGVPFGTLASAPALNTHYTVNGIPAAVRDNLGAAVSLRAAGTGGDSIRIWSRQGPGATYYPELTLTFSPATTDDEAPSVPTNVAAQVTDDDVALSWDASSDNVGVTRYRVYRGATAGFTADEGSFVDEVLSPTRTYTDNNRPAGTYYYKVIARDAAGNLSAASTAAEATVAEPPPAAETVTLLPTADSYVVSTQPTTNNGLNNQLTSRVTSPSLESFLKFDLPAAPAGTTLTGVSLTVRTSNDVTAATNDVTEFEVVGNGWAEDTITWSNRPTGAGVPFGTLASAPALNTHYTVNGIPAAVRDNLGAAVSLRAAGTGGDSIRIWSRQGPGATYYPELTLTFSPATTDDEAPSVPTNVAAQVTDDDVALSWDASSDNVGVTRYRVYRGATAGFTADEGSFVDEVLSPTRTYTDNNRPAGTYYYKVIARDAAGNLSAASTAVEAIIDPPPPTPETVQLLPTADSYVVSTQPTTNNGTNNQLTSRATSPSLETFLKFDLPAAPAGSTLTGASLQVRTSNDVTAATNDATNFEVVGNAWAEDTITWSNRPTGAGVPFGTLASAPALNTHYTVNGTPAALRDNLGAAVTLRATGTGADSIRIWSRQGPGATYYPELTLTFTPATTDDEAPSVPSNVAAQVTDDDVALSWDASTDNVGVTEYRVYRGATAGFTADVGSHLGDVSAPTRAYTDNNRPPGTYYYKVIARDAAGNASAASTAAEATIPAPPTTDNEAPSVPSNVAAQVTDDDVALSWDASTDNVGVTEYRVYRGATAGFTADAGSHLGDVSAPTRAYTDNNRPPGTYYYKVIARDAAGNPSAASTAAEATIPAPPSSSNQAPSVPSNVAAQVTDDDVALSWDASTDNVGVTEYRVYRGATAGFTADAGSHLGDVSAPTRAYTDNNRPPGTYYYKVIARDPPATPAPPRLPPKPPSPAPPTTDNEAPSVPSNVAAQVTDDDVALSWDASTDNVEINRVPRLPRRHRRVHRRRGLTPRRRVGPDTGLHRQQPATRHLLLQGHRPRRRRQRQRRLDCRRSHHPRTARTSDGTAAPTADSYVVSTQPNTNHGTNNQLTSRATSPILETFLKFDLPAAPAGTTLTGASLRVRTSDDVNAATNDATEFEVLDATWEEDTITWDNRPTGIGELFATLATAPELNTIYSVDGAPSALQDSLDGAVTLRATGTGGDSIRIWSRQGPGPSYFPELTLTFTPTP